MKNNKMNLVERTLAPTPKWFKILRTVGIATAASLRGCGGGVPPKNQR